MIVDPVVHVPTGLAATVPQPPVRSSNCAISRRICWGLARVLAKEFAGAASSSVPITPGTEKLETDGEGTIGSST